MLNKYSLLALMTMFLGLLLNAQNSTVVNPRLINEPWEAKWITHPDISGVETGVYLFRKDIDLASVPKEFVINISADNRYILYVNGKVAGRGPARSSLWRWRFETINLAAMLTKGKNHIAVKVWNMGKLKPVAQMTYQTGLIIQGNSDKEKMLNTNGSWKVTINKAYSFYKIDHLGKYYAVGPGEKFEAKLHPWQWQTGVNAGWKNARAGKNGMPMKGLTGTGLIHKQILYPREILALEAKKQSFAEVRRTEGITDANSLLKEEEDLVIPAHSNIKILLDQGHLTNAYPQLTYSNGASSSIKVTYAESLFKTQTIDGITKPVFDKGNRNEVKGKVIWGNYDIINPDGGKNRLFEPLWWRCFRYVELEITTRDEPLTLHQCENEFTAYPLEERAEFNSNNQVLSDIFETAWRTQRLCANELFYDCPYYEQLQYTGDTRIQALNTFYTSGDSKLWRKAILDYYDSRLPFGLTQSRYPSDPIQIIPNFSLVWITMLHDYMMCCNDEELVAKMLPAIIDILNWYNERIEITGLQGKMEGWQFVDWADSWRIGTPPSINKKHSSVVGLQYVYTIQKAVEIFEVLGMHDFKETWSARAHKTQKAIYKHCRDSGKNMIADTPEKDKFSQHANVLAVLTDTYDADKQQEIMRQIVDDKNIAQCSYYFTFYLVEALKKAGLANMYLDVVEPKLKELLDKGLTTFVEAPEPSRSDCHAWSASPLYFYYSLIAGIEPVSPGFNKIRIAPSLGNLKELSASMPHPKGTIKAVYNIDKKGTLTARLSIPKGTSGVFVWNNKKYVLKEGEQEFVISDK